MMMQLLGVSLLCLTSVGAFAPQQRAVHSTALSEFAKGYVGGDGPEPFLFTTPTNFDPAGFCDVRSVWDVVLN